MRDKNHRALPFCHFVGAVRACCCLGHFYLSPHQVLLKPYAVWMPFPRAVDGARKWFKSLKPTRLKGKQGPNYFIDVNMPLLRDPPYTRALHLPGGPVLLSYRWGNWAPGS